jgi:hypothetical protein
MIYDTTYKNQDYNTESDDLIGVKFTLLERLKLRGIGSSRLMIKKTSPKLNTTQLKFSEIDYANIELRPKGIIIHYTRKLERYSWVIPYYRLVIYNSQFFSIHANGNFIQFYKNKNYFENKKFINRMVQLKNDVLNLEYYDY